MCGFSIHHGHTSFKASSSSSFEDSDVVCVYIYQLFMKYE